MNTLQYENVTPGQVHSMLGSLQQSGARVSKRKGEGHCWDVTYPSAIGPIVVAAYYIGKQVVIHLIDRPAAVSPEFIDSQIKRHLGRA